MMKRHSDKSKMNYDNIFVSVVYRNTDDIIDLLKTVEEKAPASRMILVNSYFDEESKRIVEDIAEKYGCDFLNVENKGYGYANNRGIEFALEVYDFKHLIITNPDIQIEKFKIDNISDDAYLICPKIRTLDSKSQNPFWVIRNPFSEWLMYIGQKSRSKVITYSGIAINKILRELFLKWTESSSKAIFPVYAAHGSFVVFSKKVFDTIGLPFDEKMFLFSEEMYLAYRLKMDRIKTYYSKDIKVLHKEDGSMSLAKVDTSGENRKSFMYYYGIRDKIRKGE